MGSTWVIEFGIFVFTDRKAPPPESAIIVMNFVNIVQVGMIFSVLALCSFEDMISFIAGSYHIWRNRNSVTEG